MIYLVRYAEIALKGKNRSEFEKKLVENIKASLRTSGQKVKIKRLQGRLLLDSEKQVDLRKVFGIVSYSPCVLVPVEFNVICKEALRIAEGHPKTTTFKISAKRLTKEFPFSSMELNNKIGAFIVQKTGFKVQLDNPELDIGIELISAKAFVFEKVVGCFGGLPVGIEGKVLALISDEKSFLAALLLMKRGCAIELASLSEPATSLIKAFSPNNLTFHKIKGISELCGLANMLGCRAVVVNDTLKSLKDYPINMLVLRPLIAFSDEESIFELEKYQLQ
jgi:adenylyl- and sulfurtransferase ThiI